MRINKFAKQKGIGVQSILDYCEQLEFYGLSVTSKLTREQQTQIIHLHEQTTKEFRNAQLNKHILTEIPEESSPYSTTSELTMGFTQNNPFLNLEKSVIESPNIFQNRKIKNLRFEEYEVETIFEDFEAFNICYGLVHAHHRKLAKKYYKGEADESDKLVAHQIAMDTFKKYGSEMLSFIIGLPPLPFGSIDVTNIFSELDKRRNRTAFPILRILYTNSANRKQRIQIKFFAEKKNDKRVRYDNVLEVKNKENNKTLFKVSRDGVVIPEYGAKEIVPIIQLFMRFNSNTKELLLNYGLETGECAICGRPLSDPDSVRIGMGPVCRGDK